LQNPYLIAYLEGRGINPDIAAQYVQEVYFRLPQKQTCLFAIGWPSGQGFDCRVEKGDFSFKGFVGQGKDIACINMDKETSENIAVFEGWMDFLSFLTQKNITDFKHPAIIMFSVSQRKKALAKIKQQKAKRLFLFLDNDDSGKDCANFFTVALTPEMQVIDRSGLYQGFNDYNERVQNNKPKVE
jgi:5S rRNA maturation endonuclease (ribonuclease M5)